MARLGKDSNAHWHHPITQSRESIGARAACSPPGGSTCGCSEGNWPLTFVLRLLEQFFSFLGGWHGVESVQRRHREGVAGMEHPADILDAVFPGSRGRSSFRIRQKR